MAPSTSPTGILQLAEGHYIDRAENVLLVGDSGTGKTALAIGLGIAACEQGRSVRFTTVAALVNELLEARDERVLSRAVGRWGRVDLLIADELGYVSLPPAGAELLFQVLAQRAETRSVAVTSSLPFSEWTTVFSDPRLCKAVIERLTHRSHIVETGTESYRFTSSLARLKNIKSTTAAEALANERAVEAQKEGDPMSDTSDSEVTDIALSGPTTSEVSSPETSTTVPAGGAG